MIKATELRIGNLIYIGGDYEPIYRLGNKRFWSLLGDKVSNKDGFRYKYAQPIPITEDWLLKFGFENEGNKKFTISSKSHTYLYSTHSNSFYNIDGFACNISDSVIYVHQLQNLYYALTQTELEISGK